MKKKFSWLKVLLSLILVTFLFGGIGNYRLLNYCYSQAKGQIKISWYAEKIDDIIKQLPASDTLGLKLKLVQEIKKFAEDSLGLKKSNNYQYYFSQNEHTHMWMLMAAKPYEMKSFEWSYPFFGNFTYKGFFDKKKAIQEASELKDIGYDTEIGKAGAWTTLGWFKDPLLSSMLNNSTGRLAELIIHELTHGTMYVKNDVDFNENLASCIGEIGSEKFLQHKYGEDSKELKNYKSNIADDKVFEGYVFKCSNELSKLYKRIDRLSDREKEKEKRQMIGRMIKDVETLPLKDKKKYLKRMSKSFYSGNAFFLNYARYDFQKDSLKSIVKSKYKDDVKNFIKSIENRFESL